MATPVKDDVVTLDYAYYGIPLAGADGSSNVDSKTLDYTYYGMPFAVNAYSSGAAPTAQIKICMII
jgi:hypothetical protein